MKKLAFIIKNQIMKKPDYEGMYWRVTRVNLRIVRKLKDLQRRAKHNPDMDLNAALDKLLLDEMMADDYGIGREE